MVLAARFLLHLGGVQKSRSQFINDVFSTPIKNPKKRYTGSIRVECWESLFQSKNIAVWIEEKSTKFWSRQTVLLPLTSSLGIHVVGHILMQGLDDTTIVFGPLVKENGRKHFRKNSWAGLSLH